MNGMDCMFEGFRMIARPGLRRYVIVPTLINVAVLTGVVAYGISQYDAWTRAVTDSLPDWLSFLSGVFAFLAAILVFVVVLYLFTIIANIIAAPFNAVLSVKVEERLTGRTPDAGAGVIKVLARSLWREVAKLLYYLPRVIGLLILTLIPAINAAAPILWLLFGAWMMAIQYADYAADNNGIDFGELRARLGERRFQAVLFGILAYVVLAIPGINLILMPAAVAGGTVFWVEHLGR